MNKKQYKTFGITSLILSAYFYAWSVVDSLVDVNADIQRFICIILFGFGIAFLINSGLENEKKIKH